MTFRQRVYLTLESDDKGGWRERAVELFIIVIIILNILSVIVDSVQGIRQKYDFFFYHFEMFSVWFFTVEYCFRVYCIVERPGYHDPIKGRWKFMKSPLAIIDLMAFLPFYLTFLPIPIDFVFLRIVRLMALFRMFKIARYLHALKLFRQVLTNRKEQLVLSIVFILFMLVMVSTVVFYAEHDAQPDKFSSILATMWWGISTLTTVGYGDMVPVTPLGKILGGTFALAGIGLFALPAAILSSGFFELMQRKKGPRRCPHCGQPIEESE